jgi:LPS sulfotransferase NodH
MIEPLSEKQVNSADLDQPPCPVTAKIIICSTARSGSYLLCRSMIHHGIGVPHEYFNGINAATIGSRLGVGTLTVGDLEVDGSARQAYTAALLKHRTVNGIFATKIQGGQFSQYFKNSEGDELFQGARFIYLYREDLLAQAISFHVSLLTGRWGVDDTVTTQPASDLNFFDNHLIANRMEILAAQDMQWRLFFARNGISPLIFTYEGIKDDLYGTLLKIVTSFALPISSRNFSYIERVSEFSDPGVPSKTEIRDRFLQQNRRVMQGPPAKQKTMLSDITSQLPNEAQAWIGGLNGAEREFIQTVLNNGGPQIFIEHWQWHREMVNDLRRPHDTWHTRSGRSS